MIPDLVLEDVAVAAKIDFLQVLSPVRLPVLVGAKCRYEWTSNFPNDGWLLTVQDPSRVDIEKLVGELSDPPVMVLEVTVDFKLKAGVADGDRGEQLENLFRALAARFRPEDRSLFGAGFKGALTGGSRPRPFHGRLPKAEEELVYGHRTEGQNAKLYLKQRDDGVMLPKDEHSVRLETTLWRRALCEYNVLALSGLHRFGFRARLAQVFRVIERVTVRHRSRRSESERVDLQRNLDAAWARAGVNGLAPPPLPADASKFAAKALNYRAPRLLPVGQYRLHRHARAHELIGNALRQLDRRMAPRISGGSGV